MEVVRLQRSEQCRGFVKSTCFCRGRSQECDSRCDAEG